MIKQEYELIQQQVLTFAQLVQEIDLIGFIAAINKADAVGPFIDPTLYRQAHKDLAQIKNMAMSLLEFKRTALAAVTEAG